MKQITVLCFLITGILVLPAHGIANEYQWSLVKEKDGIKLFKSDTPGIKYKTYKAETVINQPLEALLEVIHDVPSFPKWMPGNRQATILKKLSPGRTDGNVIIYLVWDNMWPFNNRDIIMKVETFNDWDNDRVIIWLKNTDELDYPAKDGLVRVDYFSAEFQFSYIDREHTRVSYMCTIDPGGMVTPALAPMQTAKIPVNTVKALAKQAEDPIYMQMAKEDYF